MNQAIIHNKTKGKTLSLIGGPMGVGKTTVGQRLKKELPDCVLLDGDALWDADPFHVTEETKAIVLRNSLFVLNEFLHGTAYENIVFTWVMHEQGIIDTLLAGLDTTGTKVVPLSLIASPDVLRARLGADIRQGIRSEDVIERSLQRRKGYENLNTIKINTDERRVADIAMEIVRLGSAEDKR